tara:strand:- start:534 stop:1304 length:771 start_codon:yes stop_codon:yes gene_type:complete
MSQAHHPDFTAFGAILRTIQVMREEFLFFAILITLYVVISTVPYLFLFDGVDLTDPTVFMELALNDQPYFLVLSLAYYLLYAVFVVYILDRTNANLNNYSLNEYPYVKRAAMSAAPVILIYLITMILTSLGLVLLIVPGLIVLAGLYLAIPAKLAENISFLSAIPRSWELTKGHRLGIWGVLLIPLIPILIISFLGMFLFMSELQTSGDINAFVSPTMLTLNALVSGVCTAFYVAVSGVVYHQISNENVDEAPIFD